MDQEKRNNYIARQRELRGVPRLDVVLLPWREAVEGLLQRGEPLLGGDGQEIKEGSVVVDDI